MASFAPFEEKMTADGLSSSAIAAFRHAYEALASGSTGVIPEEALDPVTSLPDLETIRASATGAAGAELLRETVVLKLNGGLGTSMGLDKAKSLLEVKDGKTFLDLTALQIMSMRKQYGQNVRFMLMNSFNTSADTLKFMSKYPEIINQPQVELMQNKVPKVDAATMAPAEYALNPNLEWCPPGHGDLYSALYGSGTLDALLADGIKYMFVSNSDNLGATMDLDLLSYFATTDKPFLMECCRRTESDKKGGHLAVRKGDGHLVLRESAQCAKEDEGAFQDVTRHQFFNTNNLWVRLDKLKEVMEASGGFVALPLIKNGKTVNPQDSSTAAVFQLETAMGAAIECFEGAGAVVVPRTRFAPVKKCNDLMLLRSDAYTLRDNVPTVVATAPVVTLDSKKHKLVGQLEEATSLGVPSLVRCERLTVKGDVRFARGVSFAGTVSVVNDSDEPKVLPPGEYVDTTVNLTEAPGMGPLRPTRLPVTPYEGQKPGTSGLRKKTRVFMEGTYLHNFVQAVFDALKADGTDLTVGALLVGGDGRYFNLEAAQVVIKIAVANGVRRVVLGQGGLMSTPAASAVIRERGPRWQAAFGAFILSASHNPGGPEEDFGIKYNGPNGGPAPEKVTNAIFDITKTMTAVSICESFPTIDLAALGDTVVPSDDGLAAATVTVISPTEQHVALLKSTFDFDALRALVAREGFTMCLDSMCGVQGPYARKVFVEELGAPESCLANGTPLEDFGGLHADPNLTYARGLCDTMGVDRTGLPVTGQAAEPPVFGAAWDGDADRNMILGRRFFVTPSDSLAVIAAHANVIPFFKLQGGLRSVARSMPTSGAVDLVARRNNLALFEVPTGWKFFGNLMDSKAVFGGRDYTPLICGEESFGTGSDHVREKDGMWAVLAWLSILAHYNKDASQPFVHVEDIVKAHWRSYGRNYYCRYDYEGVDKPAAQAMMTAMEDAFDGLVGQTFGSYTVSEANQFGYEDPVDGSVSKKQGVRVLFTDGSRFVVRLSGTAGSGATIRLYLEKYEPDAAKTELITADALGELVGVALQISRLAEFTGRESPTVIT